MNTSRHTKIGSNRRSDCRRFRRGLATLEFVFALPILLLLMVGMTWLGTSTIRQAQVSVTARHNAWIQRADHSNDRAFEFTTNATENPDGNWVSGEATESVNVSKVFSGEPAPQSKHEVMAGSWDHQTLPLDSMPNWNAYHMPIAGAGTGDLQNLIGGLDQFRDGITAVGAQMLAKQIGLSNALNNLSNQAHTGQQSQATRQQAERIAAQIRLQNRQQVLQSQLQELNRKKIANQLTAAEDRKLFRIQSELADIKVKLRELRSLNV